MIKLEICANSLRSAINAKLGGATRIELCQDLAGGGITPSAGLIDFCVNNLQLETRVLIRPRTGHFCYSAEEVEVIRRDIALCHEIGAAAVVIGFLTDQGEIDTDLTSEMVKLAYPMEVTFHRAFDEVKDPLNALEQVIACGCTKLLTSGCAATAMEGADMLARLQRQARGRIDIIAAAGITCQNVVSVIKSTGVCEVHGSCKQQGDTLLGSHMFPLQETETSVAQVTQMVDLLNNC